MSGFPEGGCLASKPGVAGDVHRLGYWPLGSITKSYSHGDWVASAKRLPACSSTRASGPTQYARTLVKCFLNAALNRLISSCAIGESEAVPTLPLITTPSSSLPDGVNVIDSGLAS